LRRRPISQSLAMFFSNGSIFLGKQRKLRPSF